MKLNAISDNNIKHAQISNPVAKCRSLAYTEKKLCKLPLTRFMQKVENHSLNVYSIRKWKLTKIALIIMNLHIPSVMNHGAFIMKEKNVSLSMLVRFFLIIIIFLNF